MWQRFTERARKVVFYAQEEAQKFGEGYVSTEHLLLGLVREPDCVGSRVIEMVGVSLNRIRAEVEKQLPRGDARPSQDMTLTPRAKRVIDLSYDESRNLNNNYIGTEHLLLGLIREGDGLAGRVLDKLGVELERARREVMSLQDSERRNDPSTPTTSAPLKRSSEHAGPISYSRLASRLGELLQSLLRTSVTEGESGTHEAAAMLAIESGAVLNVAYLVLMALSSPSSWLRTVFEELGLDVDSVGNTLEAAFVNFKEEALTLPVGLETILITAVEEQKAAGQEKLGDEYLLLAALVLDAPLVGTTFRSLGITADKMREVIRGLEEEKGESDDSDPSDPSDQ